MYVLGIDGGGTKTIGAVCDDKGQLIAKHTVGATNPNSVDRQEVKKELHRLLSALREETSDKFDSLTTVFAGMSGVGTKENHQWMTEVLKELLPSHTKLTLDIDGVNALYSGTLGSPGIVNIAGTGSLTFGINDKGERGRAGGWGYLTDEAGSGYAIGREAIQAVFNEADGIGPKTMLTEKIRNHFSISSPYDLIRTIYEPGMARKAIAPLSQLVMEAADEGDECARRVLTHAGERMALYIGTLLTKLFSHTSRELPVPVVLTGGIYNRADWFVPIIESKLAHYDVNTIVIVPTLSPIGGTLAAALKEDGKSVSDVEINSWIKAGL